MDLLGVMDVPSWVLGIAAVLALLYIYLTKNYRYWESKGVPSIKPYPIIGYLHSLSPKPFHVVEMSRYKKYGRLYGAYEGQRPVLSISDPDLLKCVLVKDFHLFEDRRHLKTGDPICDKMVSLMTGDEWKRVRSTITPAFKSGKLRKMSNIINDCCMTLIGNLKEAARKGSTVDCKRLFRAFVMDVVCSSAFDAKIDSKNNERNQMVSVARKFREDFIQLMIDAAKEGDITDDLDSSLVHLGHEEENSIVFQKNLKTNGLSQEEVIAQCVLFFLVGYETVASVLSFAAYCLAQNPECQEQLIQEVDNAYVKHDEIDYDVVKSMPYLNRFVCETLRKYPPVVRIDRRAKEDYKLGGTGITIPKDMVITIPIYAIHYDEEYYPDPERFDPDRFLPEHKAERNPYSYLPFGAGPRNCIGMRFAQMEIKLCLVQVLRYFRFRLCSKTKVPLDYYSGHSLMVPKDITLSTESRNDFPSAGVTLRIYFKTPG